MVVATERGRDAVTRPTPRHRKARLTMLNHFTTPSFGDSRLPARFWQYVQVRDDGCWQWLSTQTGRGYGSFWHERRVVAVHRLSFEKLRGAISKGLTIDHLCRNRLCVNPLHLEPVSVRENILRGIGPTAQHARQTHCLRGHAFDASNTYYTRGTGFRYCRPCNAERNRSYRERKRG